MHRYGGYPLPDILNTRVDLDVDERDRALSSDPHHENQGRRNISLLVMLQ